MAYEFRHRRRVEFAETDMAGIVHFSNFFRYMEMAEHEFLRSLGLSVHAVSDGRVVAWPRVHAECTYEAPLTFEDEVDVHLVVRRKQRKTIIYDFCFYKAGEEKPRARGSLTVVCVLLDGAGGMSAIPIPEFMDRQIEAAPALSPSPVCGRETS
jgi:YbgC/YbaW family acyl-CoA thioester hydrolase